MSQRIIRGYSAPGRPPTAYQDWQTNAYVRQTDLDMVMTLECGARQSDDELKAAFNGYVIDLSKLRCSTRQFLASFEELREARDGTIRRETLARDRLFAANVEGVNAVVYALMWFITVNLIGIAFLAVRALVRWIAGGYNAGRS